MSAADLDAILYPTRTGRKRPGQNRISRVTMHCYNQADIKTLNIYGLKYTRQRIQRTTAIAISAIYMANGVKGPEKKSLCHWNTNQVKNCCLRRRRKIWTGNRGRFHDRYNNQPFPKIKVSS